MKVYQFVSILLGMMSVFGVAYGRSHNESQEAAAKVVIVGLSDNVRSNYFPNIMISEQTGIPVDSICYAYNLAIASQILNASSNGPISFVLAEEDAALSNLVGAVDLQVGETDAKVSSIDPIAYERILKSSGADYVLFLNQHYLKWQEKPMLTLFHITSYSLFDNRGCEVISDSNNFTSMSLEDMAHLCKSAKKSGYNIVSTIRKKIL